MAMLRYRVTVQNTEAWRSNSPGRACAGCLVGAFLAGVIWLVGFDLTMGLGGCLVLANEYLQHKTGSDIIQKLLQFLVLQSPIVLQFVSRDWPTESSTQCFLR